MDPTNQLAPIFAASVAVQQILEVFSAFVEKYVGESRKKSVLGIIGFLVGIVLARTFGLDVMSYFDLNSSIPGLDTIVTALVLSAGTEGTNSIVKFLKYLKEDKKATAADTLELLRKRSRETTGAAPASGAKRTLEKLRSRAGTATPRGSVAPTETGDSPARMPAFTYISGK
ncbi:MAG: hypothetical protein ACRD9S_14780 [Pyrinomonadaceae bacterium]